MNHKVDDGNETILSLFPLRKISLEGAGMVGRLRSLAKHHRPTIPILSPTQNMDKSTHLTFHV